MRSFDMASSNEDMSVKMKQRVVIEFLTAENVSPTEIYRRLHSVYGDETIDRTTVNRWAIRFRENEPGHGRIGDEHRSGRPVTVTDETHTNLVNQLIQNDRRITQTTISNQIGISKERVGFIITSLGYRKICSRWVPRMLTPENKERRLECCQALLNRYKNEGEEFLLKIVTGDESWIHHYDPEEKRQSMEYRRPSSPRPRKFKTIPSAKKVLLTVFWDSSTTYLKEYLEGGNTVNSERYIETLRNLRRRVCRVRNTTEPILLLHDNARPHTSRATTEALDRLKFEVLPHPPYSPDLAPNDFHFFPNLKRDIKGKHFRSDEEVKRAVNIWINSKSPEFFADGMRKLVVRWERCIELKGDFIEK